MKELDGRQELVGGSWEDRAAAREWILMFMRQAGIDNSPAPSTAIKRAAMTNGMKP